MVRTPLALAALCFSGNYRSPLSDLRRDSRGHRLLPSGFLERLEIESAGFHNPLRIVDLRRLRFRRFGSSRAAIAHRAIYRCGKKFSPDRRACRAALKLDLSALAAAGFVLNCFKSASSSFLKARHCPGGKSPNPRLPIRTRTSRFTS